VNGFTSNLLSILPEESNARLRFWVFVMDRLQLNENRADKDLRLNAEQYPIGVV
jgi:hypothetical protein